MCEAAISDTSNLALMFLDKSGMHEYVLYDVAKTSKAINTTEEEISSGQQSQKYIEGIFRVEFEQASPIVAMMSVKINNDSYYGVPTVALSAAQKGYGPTMYDIVMSKEGGLVPDRYEVSDDARKIWDYYHFKRPDVEHKRLDDMHAPKTPPKFDDGSLYRKDEYNDPLNFAYFIKSAPETGAMERRHLELRSKLEGLGLLPRKFDAIVWLESRDFFHSKT